MTGRELGSLCVPSYNRNRATLHLAVSETPTRGCHAAVACACRRGSGPSKRCHSGEVHIPQRHVGGRPAPSASWPSSLPLSSFSLFSLYLSLHVHLFLFILPLCPIFSFLPLSPYFLLFLSYLYSCGGYTGYISNDIKAKTWEMGLQDKEETPN